MSVPIPYNQTQQETSLNVIKVSAYNTMRETPCVTESHHE